ncbi:MAG: bifunctional phosphoribosylaminoimidazolecarboxamide formyltransferase/IMP cyclohydrolase [Treponema sp.]|jgi:phosphoribosylaminoimidazolecarboxamide formyltransferase/IMP cyclohydrolase|nr:bifunctional phosphoribosylaminoimidazolecarboxamide formyltransferase/IMP cyclohydrolase [Treponema sp.]
MPCQKRALLSVYDKTGLDALGTALAEAGWEILSTGGTARTLQENHIPVTEVSRLTGFPECLDGRVKTLHPAVHAGLLARRDNAAHRETLERLQIPPIDLLCVNLYPFFETAQQGLSLEETIEFIDIGGPAMLRSAAKNYAGVIVLSDWADYGEVIAGLKNADDGTPALSLAARRRLAGKVFSLTAAYDAAVAQYLLDLEDPASGYPAYWPLSVRKAQSLRYGENAHQSAALYLHTRKPGALGAMEQLGGKELGYNNIRDLDLAWKAVSAFGIPGIAEPLGAGELRAFGLGETGAPYPAACVAVKHHTPCGIAAGATLAAAYTKAHACDPVSIFGGIVACNVPVDAAAAEKLGEVFLEILIAPDFDPQALDILQAKKNLRIIRASRPPADGREYASVDGGLLVQETDRKLLESWRTVTRRAVPPEDIPDMLFGLRAAAYVKSNAVVVVKDRAAAGICGGQTNRIGAAELALKRSALITGADEPARVLASDAFFPFPDVVKAAAAAGIRTIIQPGGSQQDDQSIAACDSLGIAMVFTGTRHFKH